MIEQLFGSKTRVKLLYLFLGNPDRSFFVREITRKIDEQINSVRRELSNLLNIGIITSESSNNKLYYSANKLSPHYEALSAMFLQPSSSSDGVASVGPLKLSDRFQSLGGIALVVLLGSFVRKANGDNSNLDIFVVGSPQKRKLVEFIKELEEEEGRVLNYTLLTEADFKYRVDVNDRFIANILKQDKIVVLDTQQFFRDSGDSLPTNKIANKE